MRVLHGAGGGAGHGYDAQRGTECSKLAPPTCGLRTARTSVVHLGGGHAARAAILLHVPRQ